MEIIIEILTKLGMALLGAFFSSVGTSAKDAGIDSTILDYLYQLVSSAEVNPALADGSARYDWVFGQAVTYLNANKINLAITLLESLIQLAVHHAHTTSGTPGQTVSSVVAATSSASGASSAKSQ